MDDQSAGIRHAGDHPRDVLELAPSARAPAPERAAPSPSAEPAPPKPAAGAPRRGLLLRFGVGALKVGATLLVLAGAVVAALVIWNYYVVAPWTRDGRVRVQVASVAPQVSGQVTELRIVDNQFVHKGDVLYVIDRFDFQNALDQARTQVKMKAADFQVKSVQAERRQHLSDLATTPEQQQQYVGSAMQAEAGFRAAQVQEAMAEINLDRTNVRSPVNGFITNFQMRVGDYAREGTSNLSIIDADSYWVDGYFEETKMSRVCVGDRAEAKLMGYRQPIVGEVQSVTRGIAVSDATSSTQGLPDVNPIYTWVRLAQRVPVRIRITDVPPGVPLVSGMTATVSVSDPGPARTGPWWRQRLDVLGDQVTSVFERPRARPGCLPPDGSREGRIVTIPTPAPTPPRTPKQINPGLTPGMTQSPKVQ